MVNFHEHGVGTKVWDYRLGHGVISQKSYKDNIYPISCKFDTFTVKYTIDGKLNIKDKNPLLFLNKPKTIIPIPDKEKTYAVGQWFRWHNNLEDFSLLVSVEQNTVALVNITSGQLWQTHKCGPYTIPVKDIEKITIEELKGWDIETYFIPISTKNIKFVKK